MRSNLNLLSCSFLFFFLIFLYFLLLHIFFFSINLQATCFSFCIHSTHFFKYFVRYVRSSTCCNYDDIQIITENRKQEFYLLMGDMVGWSVRCEYEPGMINSIQLHTFSIQFIFTIFLYGLSRGQTIFRL